MNEGFFQGHFPGNPIMPGVLQLEAMAQCAAPILLKLPAFQDKLALFAGMENVRFKNIVRPGDRLDMEIELTKIKKHVDGIKSYSAETTSDGIKFIITFENEEKLLDAHFAGSGSFVEVFPVFYFYINHGSQVGCPGSLKFLNDGVSVEYTLSEIEDFANAVALTDQFTVTNKNILSLDFNIYLEHKYPVFNSRSVVL
jgi:3-hydroxymyristoyl/3-hydroxydecanoyl-(acyl carrier protein) dehydratase